ncbi:putative membrane protein [Silvibacterium bohemicum]|uniref:Putative membrane protein n=1 Tax=Silvibacterium bohemicum TaxID=1577686 RepID=A0A841JYF0_9BACT|nr:hypothetical protein [Silvibacterium bohemicum]MBB6144001.1 putative membrane protein [Silvibacterium bohemicum]
MPLSWQAVSGIIIAAAMFGTALYRHLRGEGRSIHTTEDSSSNRPSAHY